MALPGEISNVKVNGKAIEALYSSGGVVGDMKYRAYKIKSSAEAKSGEHYKIATRRGRHGGRPYTVIATGSQEAAIDNANNNTLAKSYDAGR